MPVVDFGLAEGATRYTIPKLVLVEVPRFLPIGNCWDYGSGYWMGSRFVERMFDCLGLIDRFAQ